MIMGFDGKNDEVDSDDKDEDDKKDWSGFWC